MITTILLILFFLVLTFKLIVQIFISIREKFGNRHRLYVIGIMTIVLTLTFFFPGGLINFEIFESESILIAQREGVANCMTTLRLKKNNKFVERSVCFGITETTGEYTLKKDTIFFENISVGRNENDYFKFAVIKNLETKDKKYKGDLVLFRKFSDTTGLALLIIKNELTK